MKREIIKNALENAIQELEAKEKELYPDSAEEYFLAFFLNSKNQISGFSEVSHGTVSETIVHPREIFKGAVLSNASSIIIAHNHPSGVLTPSQEDDEVTQRIKKAGDILGIRLLDHVIVDTDSEGGRSYFSYREAGKI